MEYNIAFSSSGARFAAHVGVLAYLQDNDIRIKNFSGTSGGAIVACWGANNLPARELLELTVKFGHPFIFSRLSLKIGGLLDHSLFGETIAHYCKPKKNLWIVTFNVLKMQKEIWNGEDFNLSKVLTATTCVPGLFKPVIYSNGVHIDGIFAKFCPDDLWNEGLTISVHLRSKNKTKCRYPFDFFMHMIEKNTIDFLYNAQKDNTSPSQVIYVQPDVSSIAQTDFFLVKPKDHIELFYRGYKAAEEILSDWLTKKNPAFLQGFKLGDL